MKEKTTHTRIYKKTMKELELLFPRSTQAERIEKIYDTSVLSKNSQEKINQAGRFLYGQLWPKKKQKR